MDRLGFGAAALVVLATACGQPEHTATSRAGSPDLPASPDVHAGADEVCTACSAVADGLVTFAGTTMRFTLQAASSLVLDSAGLPVLQPGAGGIGAASSGSATLVPVAGGEGLSGAIDTVVSCGRTAGVLSGTFSGLAGGQRFTVAVTDGSSSGLGSQTTVALTAPSAMGPALVESGFLHVDAPFACHPTCDGADACWCLVGLECETCEQANHGQPIPTCLDGTCWSPVAAACEPCVSQPAP